MIAVLIALAAALAVTNAIGVVSVAVFYAIGLAVTLRKLPRFSPAGSVLLTSSALLVPAGLAWFVWFVLSTPLSIVTQVLLLLPTPFALLFLPVMAVRTFENCEALIRSSWSHPREPLPRGFRAGECPLVSIHVPAHAEPPAVVIETLNSLAALDYPNFEVLLIDNNTTDEKLWRPVEARCRELGPRFRFLHVEGLTGAKAGALNYALDHTHPAASLVAVVDADYQAAPNFLSDTVAFFDEEAMGFVQTPHAYREWGSNLFQRICNFEYAFFFGTGMVSLNERNAGITVGTMCVIRREALEQAGRWATWCLTEDSELAVRIHALGYSSVFLRQVYGRGLIPETFAGYRKQRFRWTYGPVTELQRHYRYYLPGRWRRPSAMTFAQRLHHLTHGLYGMAIGLGLLLLPWGIATAASMIVHQERVTVPLPLWMAITALTASAVALRYVTYRDLLSARWTDWLGASLASVALAHVVMVANLMAVLRCPVPWQRTDKFRRRSQGIGALAAVRGEMAFGVMCAGISLGVFALAPFGGLITLLAVGLLLCALHYAAAPALTLLADSLAPRNPSQVERCGGNAPAVSL